MSCCVVCQEYQHIFVPSGHSLIMESAKNRRGATSGEYGEWSIILMDFLVRNLQANYVQGHCHGGESTCQVRFQTFSTKHIPVTLSALLSDTVDS
jgi:hypothetical protein